MEKLDSRKKKLEDEKSRIEESMRMKEEEDLKRIEAWELEIEQANYVFWQKEREWIWKIKKYEEEKDEFKSSLFGDYEQWKQQLELDQEVVWFEKKWLAEWKK